MTTDRGCQLTDAEAATVFPDDPQLPEGGLAVVTADDLATFFGVTRRTVCNWRWSGFLPRPIYSSSVITLWLTSEINEWIEGGGSIWGDDKRASRLVQQIGTKRLTEVVAPATDPDPTDAAFLPRLEGMLLELDAIDGGLNELPPHRCSQLRAALEEAIRVLE